MNKAAAELCLDDVNLLNRRGELLQKAREKAAETYVFKKGRSRLKSYGAPKYDKDARNARVTVIEEDITRILRFKEKRLLQAEAARNYKTCEQLTEDMMVLKARCCAKC